MNHIVTILFFSVVSIFLLFDYIKDRKIYTLLAIIPILIAIFYQTSISKNISNTLSILLTLIMVIVAIVAFYLGFTDRKRDKQ